MTKEEFDQLRSNRVYPCPNCGSYSTEPYPGCQCPVSDTGFGTKHINLYYHRCRINKEPSNSLIQGWALLGGLFLSVLVFVCGVWIWEKTGDIDNGVPYMLIGGILWKVGD